MSWRINCASWTYPRSGCTRLCAAAFSNWPRTCSISLSDPELIKEELFKVIREYLGDDFDMSHFTPSYRPWQQRLAFVPDGDLFEGIKSGKVIGGN